MAWRILLFALLLNVVTLGSVQLFVHYSQENWFQRERDRVITSVIESAQELTRVYSAESLVDAGADADQVRALISNPTIQQSYEDVIVTSGQYGNVYLNPRGAVHRDPDTFPQAMIVEAMARAGRVGGTVAAAGGKCFAVREGGTAVGYVWFKPRSSALPSALPFWTTVVALCIGVVLFGIVLLAGIRRTVGRPLAQLHEAASAVAGGSYAARLPDRGASGEFAPVMAAFNRMAEEVESHTSTLEHEVRQAVDEAKQKERALVMSSRLASLGTLAAGVAHEVNNPIGGMQNAVRSLLASDDLTERQRKYLELVQNGLQRIGRTTRRLLDFSPKEGQASEFALAGAVEQAVALIEHRQRQLGVSLQVDVPPDLPKVRGEAHEIQQVVLNLLLNSLDALEERPRGSAKGTVTVQAQAAGGFVQLTVADNGPGMDPADLDRVFDPFFTKKDRPDASGLGMFISYSIIQNHGGEFTVDSKLGEGFCTEIRLPVVAS
ncbi:MAG: HAMP domain-containing histidine kinase [bacterium]|nr:HAMP domain-containing histidine kinase [bacterium]